jgi:hypothetical protein
MRRGVIVIAIAATLGLLGCAGQVVVSQYKVAPTNDVELAVVYRAKPGTCFSDIAEKTLNVSVSVAGRSSSQPAIYLFSRQYTMVTSDIDWSITWESPDSGRVDFVVYPPGVDKYDVAKEERKSRATPIGHIVVGRQSPDAFEIRSEKWTLPYSIKDYPRGLRQW